MNPVPSQFPFLSRPILQPFIDRNELAGAVTAVADQDEILSLEAVGFASLADQKPMRTDALFWIASQTKPITATALMMLVETGDVDIEAPVERYLPEFAGQLMIAEQTDDHLLLKKPAHPLTVRNVLSHTGGLPFLSPLEQPWIDSLKLRQAAQIYALLPLQWEPGTQYGYSNAGTNIAGCILEVVSGQPYEEFLQQRLFDPLGLTDTTFWPSAEQLSRLATSYRPTEAGTGLEETHITYLRAPYDSRERFATPGGGLFSTAPDMARFCQMLLRGGELDGKRYLEPETVRLMTSRHTGPDLKSYGFCWEVQEHSFEHGGAYSTNMKIHKQAELVTVFLVQHAGFPGEGGASSETWQRAALEHFGSTP